MGQESTTEPVSRGILRLDGPALERSISPGEIHVYQIRLDRDGVAVTAMNCLTDEEKARADRFCFDRDRRRYITCRSYLRKLLAQYVGCGPLEITLAFGRRGKPHLVGAALGFNVSHSEELALIALTREPNIGVDIEFNRPLSDIEAMILAAGSAEEKQIFARVDGENRLRLFYRMWARKEALLKVEGAGLAMALTGLTVLRADGAELTEPVSVAGQGQIRVFDLPQVPSDFAAALAVPWSPGAPVASVRFLSFGEAFAAGRDAAPSI
jgi:4'-phosphopantetheinyl transferase